MKVMFLFQGLPHYYNYVLNRLMEDGGVELVNVVPGNSKHMGDGVYQTDEDIKYRLCKLDEYNMGRGGLFFKGLWRLLLKERPDVVITTAAHIRGFLWNVPAFLVTRLLGIKLILKSIPFRVERYEVLATPQRVALASALAQPSPAVRRLCGALGFSPDSAFERLLCRIHYPLRWLIGTFHVELELWRVRIMFTLSDAHVNYVEEAKDLLGSYGVPPEKIFITYNSPDTDRMMDVYKTLLTKGVEKHPHRLIHVGRLAEWKRVDLLLRALVLVKERFSDADLLVLGDGPKLDEWTKLSQELGLQASVYFSGGVYQPELLGAYLMSSAIYVLAGMGGLSINEAMCFGLPVICSVCDGTEKKIVMEGRNGTYFKEGDYSSLADRIIWLFEQPELMMQMGAQSLDIIRNEMNVHTVIDGYLRAFEYVTGESRLQWKHDTIA
jgi:glycosyltransferase involved in cell wall biosynthesis